MPSKLKLKVRDSSDEEEDVPRVANSAKKGKRSRQIVDGSSDSEPAPPSKRRTPSVGQSKPRKQRPSKKSSVEFTDSENEDQEANVDVEGTDSDAAPRSKAVEDDDAADTDSSHSASTVGRPAPRRQHSQRPEKASKSRSNRIQSDEDGDDYERQSDDDQPTRSSPPARPKPAPPIARPPTRQPTASSSSTPTPKPLRKPITKAKDDKPGLGNIPAIPRRPKDASAVVKDTQDMDLLNKDVYNQLFNTSSTPKPAKHTQNEAKQKEINAKRAAAKAALLEARTSSFDLQLPTDKVLAFENRLKKLHRWYAPSALGFTYHEEVRLQRQRQQRLGDGNSNPHQSGK